MENDTHNTQEEVSAVEPAVATKSAVCKLKDEFCALFKKEFTPSEIILFAAAFATLPLMDFIAKALSAFNIPAQALYILVPVVTFAGAYWLSRNKVNPFGILLHSIAAISILMAAIALLPGIPGAQRFLTGPGVIALGMPILGFIFLYAAARMQNTGASYIFAAIAATMLFFLSAAQLLGLPCNNAISSGAANAESICKATPYFQNTLIPVAIFLFGYFTFKKSN